MENDILKQTVELNGRMIDAMNKQRHALAEIAQLLQDFNEAQFKTLETLETIWERTHDEIHKICSENADDGHDCGLSPDDGCSHPSHKDQPEA